MSTEREMTLDEWMARLPESHAANRELAALRARVAELEACVEELEGRAAQAEWAANLPAGC